MKDVKSMKKTFVVFFMPFMSFMPFMRAFGFQNTPFASIASATFANPARLAPWT